MTNLYSDYPNGFEHGVTIRNIPVNIATNPNGKVFWVDSKVGNNLNRGTPKHPFATLAYAITQCTASKGDIIYLAPGHAETVASAEAINLNISGVTIVFLGEGSNRATLNFSTVTNASLNVGASDVTIINFRGVSGIDALTAPITINSSFCTFINAEWYDVSAKAATHVFLIGTNGIMATINGFKFYASTFGTQKQYCIGIEGASDITLKNIDITGDFSIANIDNSPTATTNLRLENIKLKNLNATPKPGMVLQANTTGQAKNLDFRIASGSYYVNINAKMNWDDNCLGYNADGLGGDPIGGPTGGSMEAKVDDIQTDIGDPSARTNFPSIETMIGVPDAANSNLSDMIYTGFDSSAVVPGANGSVMERLEVIQGEVNKLDTATLAVSPTAGSLATFVASGGTALGTALAASKSLVDAIGSNGSTLVYGSGSILGAIGTVFWIKKTMVSSAILSGAPVDITGVSSGGELAVEDVVVKTDGTGLAGGTNFELKSNNARGQLNFFVETVANLGGSATVDSAGASVLGEETVLETGKKFQVQATVGDCTGAGEIDIYIKLRRLSAGATVAPL